MQNPEPLSPPNPEPNIGDLLRETKKLHQDYETRFDKFRSGTEFGRLIGDVGIEVLQSWFGIPKHVTRKGVNAFLKRWEKTPEYSEMRGNFANLLTRVTKFMSTVSKETSTLRPPGNSAKLLAKLKPVHNAVKLDTKFRRLVAALEEIEGWRLIFNKDIPERPARLAPTRTRKPRGVKHPVEDGVAWGVMGIAASMFVGLAIFFSNLFVWFFAIALALLAAVASVVGLLLTRGFWAPRISKFSRHLQRIRK